MCFSAPASFSASAVLAAIGTLTLCRIPSKRWILLALIPWFFAIQQCAEGVVWLNIGTNSYLAELAKNIFLFFAFVFWPIWIPLSLFWIEKQSGRRQWMFICLVLGIVVSGALTLFIPYSTANVYRCSIHYEFELTGQYSAFLFLYDKLDKFVMWLYVLVVMAPLFVSSIKKMWIFGCVVAVLAAGVYSIDQFIFISMWCFFSALLSLLLFMVIKRE